MTYASDLATACMVASGPGVRAIGWLERGQPMDAGAVDPPFVAALERHLGDPGRWLAVVSCGVHRCDLGGCDGAAGAQYVVIPSPACVFIAPDLVAHYVAEHRYAPPPEFVAAVLACPEQSSAAYVELLVPFASIWRLDAATVRRIAARAPEARAEHARAQAQYEASRGHFKW